MVSWSDFCCTVGAGNFQKHEALVPQVPLEEQSCSCRATAAQWVLSCWHCFPSFGITAELSLLFFPPGSGWRPHTSIPRMTGFPGSFLDAELPEEGAGPSEGCAGAPALLLFVVLGLVPPLCLTQQVGLGWAGDLPAPTFPSQGAALCPSCGKFSSMCELSALTLLPNSQSFRGRSGKHSVLSPVSPCSITDNAVEVYCCIFWFVASVASQNFLFHLQAAVNTEPVTSSVVSPPWST